MRAAAALLVLAAVLPLAGAAHAQDDPEILRSIAVQAEERILEQLRWAYGDQIPQDISQVLALGTGETALLEDALAAGDIDGARSHFLAAMGHFRQITAMTGMSGAGSEGAPAGTARDLGSELNRLERHADRLREISDRHGADIGFGRIYELVQQARQEIGGQPGDPYATMDLLQKMIHEAEALLREQASEEGPQRDRDFAYRQLAKIEQRLGELAEADPGLDLGAAYGLADMTRDLLELGMIDEAKASFAQLAELMPQLEAGARR